MLTPEQLEEARQVFAEQARKNRERRKKEIAEAQAIKATMTVEEKIKFVNTPFDDMPLKLKPGMTKHPQKFNFVHIRQPHIGLQKETLAARVIRFRQKYKMSRTDFLNVCNIFAEHFDAPKQKTRLTMRDLVKYEDFNVCPKIDKMVVMAKATGFPIDFYAGYGKNDRRSDNPNIESRFRKR